MKNLIFLLLICSCGTITHTPVHLENCKTPCEVRHTHYRPYYTTYNVLVKHNKPNNHRGHGKHKKNKKRKHRKQ